MFEKPEERVALVIGLPFLVFFCVVLSWGRGSKPVPDKAFYEERESFLKSRVEAAEKEGTALRSNLASERRGTRETINMEVDKVKAEATAKAIVLDAEARELREAKCAFKSEKDLFLKAKEAFENNRAVFLKKAMIADKVVEMYRLESEMRMSSSRSELQRLIKERQEFYRETVKLINQ